jgi:outer membrane protein
MPNPLRVIAGLSLAALAALAPAAPSDAQELAEGTGAAPISAPVLATQSAQPRLTFSLRGGVAVGPSYFGASDTEVGPDFAIGLGYARLFGLEFGDPTTRFEPRGFRIKPAFRYIGERNAADHPELAGLATVDAELELGLGAVYTQRNYEIFGELRYGTLEHNSFVGEVGADLRLHPSDRLEVWFGPRLLFGSDRYASTYYGVTAAESAASGLAAHSPSGGLLRAGVELGANLDIAPRWDLEGAVSYDRLLNGAAASPITRQGSEEQLGARIGLVRHFSLRF